MSKYGSMIPEGTCDRLFKECEALRDVQSRMTELFKSRGFSEVITPSIEFYDVFSKKESAMPQEMMYKLIDAKGHILAMRPDNTMPVVRVVSTKLKDFLPPLRLFYNQNVFRVNPSLSGRRDEIPQCGIELIGADGIKSDLEVIATAIDSLKSVSSEFRFEIGHVGFFKAIIDSLSCDKEHKEQIRRYIETKNYASITAEFDMQNGTADAASRALIELPRLFGGSEVFDKALTLAPNAEAVSTINYLKSIYDMLCQMGLKNNIMIDLGMVQQIDYYTGVVFRGYMQGSGEPVLSGGRYDGLFDEFDVKMAATGFAVNTDAVASVINEQKSNRSDVIVFFDTKNAKAAFEHMETLISSGFVCEMSSFDDYNKTLEYAKAKGIHRIDTVDEEITTVNV